MRLREKNNIFSNAKININKNKHSMKNKLKRSPNKLKRKQEKKFNYKRI